jgi:PKD repeat protein
MHLAIGLPLRNQEALGALIKQIYDPASPQYHQYLTTEQFTERFGPTKEDYQAVMDFAKANRLTVTATFPNRVLVDVEGTVADVEKALHVTMRVYQHPTEARTFYSLDSEPSMDLTVPILHIGGLDNYSIPHPNFRLKQPGTAPNIVPNAGSGPSGNYMGKDFRAAYVPGTALTGSGQIVGLLQFDGYFASDITYYKTVAGLPDVTLTNIYIDGATGATNGSGGEVEVSLDIEMVISMAPGITKVMVYEAPNPSPWEDLMHRMANDNLAKQISCSWGGGSPDPTAEAALVQMATQGQSFFNATGDSDAFTGAIPFPSDSTNVVQVGGTTLTTAGPTNNWVSETVWNWGYDANCNCYVGSSGGISTYYSIPPWQLGVSMASNQGSTTNRNVPDVALTADSIYVRADGVDNTGIGGTSCAAPLWAGFTALVNQQAVAGGHPTVGFLNPALYTIGKGTNYTSCFHDITTGNNEWPSSPTKFLAVTGYDLCTGWGTPTGTNLINALAGPPTNAPVLVANGAIVTGGNGNGVIDANECNLLNILIQNIGAATATTVNATLTTTTPGVTITQPVASYPNVPPNSFATNSTPFQISTSPAFVCGTPVSLSLVLSYAQGSTTGTLVLATCQCPGLQITGGLSAASPKQTGRLTRNGITNTCASAKSCPGYFTTSGAYAYQAFSFTNTSGSATCATVTLSTACSGTGSTAIFSETYLGGFSPNSLCTGYLGDLGSSPATSGSYSFNVPANTNFTVVVNAVNVGSYCSSFTVTVAGLACLVDGGGACAGVSASFSGTPTSGTAPLLVTFTDTSSGTITNRFWDFGDSSTTNTTTNTVVHTYAAGTDTVELVVAGLSGVSTNTKPNYITVFTPFQAWQIQYFGSTTNPAAAPTADPDGDGFSNLQEFLDGTDPTNGASSFRITSIVSTGDDVLINWMTGIGRTNALQATAGTGAGGYNTNNFAGIFTVTNTTGPLTNYLDVGAATNIPSRFYRVRLVP